MGAELPQPVLDPVPVLVLLDTVFDRARPMPNVPEVPVDPLHQGIPAMTHLASNRVERDRSTAIESLQARGFALPCSRQ